MDRQALIDRHNRLLGIAKRAEAAVKRLPHVASVGIGFKTTGGKMTDEAVIVVWVDQKVDRARLAPQEVVPATLEGVKTDVMQIPRHELASNKSTSLEGGTAITQGSGYGTLGCCVKITSSGSTAILSNQHVLDESGDVYTGTSKGSCAKAIATRTSAQQSGTVDAAVATLTSHGSATNSINGISGSIAGINTAVLGEAVQKSGARTGYTTGTVTQVGASISTDTVTLTDQLVLQTANPQTDMFLNRGDSGSVLLNMNMEVIGLCWAGHLTPPYTGDANTIQNVITAMGITIPYTAGATAAAVAAAAPAVADADDVPPSEWGPLWDQYRAQLSQYKLGLQYVNAILANNKEVQDLVHHNRAVTLAWNTNQGPAFAQIGQQMVQNPQQIAQKSVGGVTVQTALENMIIVLLQNGSPQLQQAITTYSVDATNYINCSTFQDILNIIQQSGPATGP